METQEPQDQMRMVVLEDHPDHPDHPDQTEMPEHQEIQDNQERQVNYLKDHLLKDHPDHQGQMDHLDHPDNPDLMETQEVLDHQDHPDQMDNQEAQETPEVMDNQEPPVNKVLKGRVITVHHHVPLQDIKFINNLYSEKRKSTKSCISISQSSFLKFLYNYFNKFHCQIVILYVIIEFFVPFFCFYDKKVNLT